MPLVDTSDNSSHTHKQQPGSDQIGGTLVVKLNAVIRDHFPPGQVDYPDVIRALLSLAMSYKKGLEILEDGRAGALSHDPSGEQEKGA